MPVSDWRKEGAQPPRRFLRPMVCLLLSGVADFQINEEPHYKPLSLHGPKSIYERLIQEVPRR
jgi:hypothetical protein